MQKYYCDYIQEIETREGKQQPKLCIISDTRGMGQYKDCTVLFFLQMWTMDYQSSTAALQ